MSAAPSRPAALLARAVLLAREDRGAGYGLLRFSAPDVAAAAAPGQFVHLRVPALEPSALRRPFSICDADPAAGTVSVLYKEVGRGTAAMAALAPGDPVDLMGPLGRGFPPPPPGAVPLLAGGGYGVAPLLFLARTLLAAGRADGIRLFAGGRTAADLLLLGEFRALGVEVDPATDDGSLGERGLVTAPLDRFLAERTERAPVVLYACGPAPMLRALDGRAVAGGFPAWLSLDRRMACGVGACCGCAQKVRGPDGAVRVAMVCSDGPVFPQGTIVW